MSSRLLSVGLGLLIWGYLGAGQVQAIPIIHGHGDTITFLADLPDNAPARQMGKNPGDRPTKLGFKYWYFHLFWASVWTSSGEFVAYQNDRPGSMYFKLGNDAEKAAQLAGLNPEQVAIPWSYRFPLGWWIAGALILFMIFRSRADKNKEEVAQEQRRAPTPLELQLLADPRYQTAMAALNLKEQSPDKLSTSEIQRGIESLVEQGVPREEAEQNLALVLSYLRGLSEAPSD